LGKVKQELGLRRSGEEAVEDRCTVSHRTAWGVGRWKWPSIKPKKGVQKLVNLQRKTKVYEGLEGNRTTRSCDRVGGQITKQKKEKGVTKRLTRSETERKSLRDWGKGKREGKGEVQYSELVRGDRTNQAEKASWSGKKGRAQK